MAIGLMLVGCGFAPDVALPGDRAPVIVTGVVVDQAGAPMAEITVELHAMDWSTTEIDGQVAGTGMFTAAVTDDDGRFEIGGFPPEAPDFVVGPETVEFELIAVEPGAGVLTVVPFTRDFAGDGWVDPAPDLRLIADDV